MKKLTVPYYSQWDTDATFSRDDCVPTCAAMLVAYYGGRVTTDQLAKLTGTGLVDFEEIKAALASFNYKIVGTSYKTLDDLKKSIDANIPFLAIIHYGDLPGRQDTYTGGHAVVVTGYDDTNIYVNDPDFWSPRRNEGAGKAYPIAAFNTSWQSKADGNYPGNFWYIEGTTPEPAPLPTPGFDIALDIPTEVEDKYDLKSKSWYNKHWNFGNFIEDCVKTHKLLNEYEKLLEDAQKEVASAKVTVDSQIEQIKAKDKQIETLQLSNAENTAQLTVMGDQVKEANRQKALVEAAKLLADGNIKLLTLERDTLKAQVFNLNSLLVQNLKGYSGWVRFKSLFGFYN